MSYLIRTLRALLLILLCAAGVSQADEPQLSPHPGVLVLRTGRVLSGNIVRVGDRYVIALGDRDEVGVSADCVEMHCGSLDEAYRQKRNLLPPNCPSARHLALGDWCLRYDLISAAAEQLMAAQRLDPDNRQVTVFEKRLRLAAKQPAVRTSGKIVPRQHVPQTELDQLVRAMPSGAVEQFTEKVQPLLLNRCGANSCHGPNSKSGFRLISPNWSRVIPRRFTQRNLLSAVKLIDKDQPRRSPLLVKPTIAHGGAEKPALSELDTTQLQQLAEWVHKFAGNAMRAQPVALNSPESILLQPGARSETRPETTRSSHADRSGQARAMPGDPRNRAAPAPQSATRKQGTHRSLPASGKDPFDPEIFNRRYLK